MAEMTNKKNIKGFLVILILLAGCITISGCSAKGNSINNSITSNNAQLSGIEKIELFHFHLTRQCYSCVTLGNYAEETVKTYFADELESGRIVFGHINAELPENRVLAMKYGATGSSLWIGVYRKDGSFSKEENTNIWYKINDKQDYMDYLKQVLEQKLSDS